MKRILVLAALAALSSAASAQLFTEAEPNDTFASANVLVPIAPLTSYSLIGVPSLTANDVDYFRLNLTAGTILSAITFPRAGDYTPDTLLGLFDSSSSHVLLAQNDDFDGSGGSAMDYRITATGDYFIGVTGTGEAAADGGFTGTHTQAGQYQLVIGATPQAVPEPAGITALGVGLLALVRRRNGAKRS